MTTFDLRDIRPVVRIHHRAAQESAHRIFCLSSTVFAKSWIDQARDDTNEDLFNFAFHSFRLCEILDIKVGQIDISEGNTLHFEQAPPWPWELDFRSCLNAIRHCTSFKVGNSNAADSRKLFKHDTNLTPSFVVVSTDRYKEDRSIPIFALSFSYLQHVRPLVATFLNEPQDKNKVETK